MGESKNATKQTAALQNDFLRRNFLDLSDKQDFEDADRGFIACIKEREIKSSSGALIWSEDTYSFLNKNESAPDTVNPSLWRQAQLNARHGLYKVTDGIYQVRGYDVANITFIEGGNGYIIVDTLTNAESSAASVKLFYEHVGKKPVTAIIYTHSHADHWGGSEGVISKEEAAQRQVPIYAPARFMEKAVSENILAGNAMIRRGAYMFGTTLPHDERGNVDSGLGKSFSNGGAVTLIPPTITISEPKETHIIDGVEIVFTLTPETEAPAEMVLFFPALRAFCPAELCTQVLHNIYTIRGAETRDAKAWAGYINEAVYEYGGKFDVVFSTHNWPVWGSERGKEYLKKQRDIYKFIHDQTLRLANQGCTMKEIAEQLQLPKGLAEVWHTRGNYGSVSHNAKAVYNRYLGYYDGNPATLNELPPIEAAKKYIQYMGGAKNVLTHAREDFEKGEYRFAAEVLRRLLFAEPENSEALSLQADTLEQLGYAAESAPWRNAYLTGAQELRNGIGEALVTGGAGLPGIMDSLSMSNFFDFLSVRLNYEKAEGKTLTFNFNFTDTNEQYVLTLENGVINYCLGKQAEKADTTLKIDKRSFLEVAAGKKKLPALILTGKAKADGNPLKLAELMQLVDHFDSRFAVVLP
ncbi:alkyl sulfatase [Spirochaetia bacterium]|nr:alkyl sulfatase [Spirochaetia bacterium]